jgi:hypothetical protein
MTTLPPLFEEFESVENFFKGSSKSTDEPK